MQCMPSLCSPSRLGLGQVANMAPVCLACHLSLSFICFILLFLANFMQRVSPTLSYDCQTLLEIGLSTQILDRIGNKNQGFLPP